MRSLLTYFPLYKIVTVLAGLPILIALLLATNHYLDYQSKVTSAEHDQETVKLILLYDNLAHNLALERGLTAGVIGAKGQGPQVETLKKQRQESDVHITALLSFTPSYLDSSLANQLKTDVNKQLTNLKNVRDQIDELKLSISPFAYYSNLNQLAIDNSLILLSVIDNPVVAELGSSLISVVIMKERAGQVRGALNGAFASKSSDAAQYTAINGYIESGRYAERSALMTMSDELRNSLSQMKNNSVWQSVVNTQQSYLNQKATLDKLQGPAPQEWFSTATEQIKLINQLRNSIQTQMIDLSSTQSQHAVSNKWLIMIFSILIGLGLISSLYFSVLSLKSRVGNLTKGLAHMSAHRDLSQELKDSGKDEISQISRSVNGLTESIRRVLQHILNTNEHSTEQLAQIVTSSQQLGRSSQETNAKCANIAAAMTQLSQSSVEIAQSSERALEETKQMTDKVIACQTQSLTSFRSVEALVDQIEQTQKCMKDLETDAENISKIVDTINGISEQTNLLALNAAIEAARAGEHGRGFAVVSSEVRDLAQRSKLATEHISQLLANISSNTNTAVKNMDKSREATHTTFDSVSTVKTSVAELESVIELVNQHINSIANATTEQSTASDAVDRDVDVLAEIAQNTGSLATTMNSIVSDYQHEMDEIRHRLAEFKLQ
ncbi:methyl-accepting chemotaxis protein [Vibrio cholerae]|uniref:Chemotaxis protein n=1 Tax=Vibrio paracholerae TaxID=650003 RepID=A0AAX1QRS7_9VIBR|nr:MULTISPECIES: methyl-accepting chemotaxis protein [Vibrio]EGR5063199.1 methyl-accepting chemotaxis protein [Vibrio cholerae]MBY3673751.1 methyl-accepting chemotaxis protein [Vibrio cholerae]MDP4497522.1 methyl-accepting chemotaxis protein [Vibrio cholerae]MDV2334603.1 methyl-accepting chemotaxis protein [Vibrio cholerae]RBM51218.1 chemotaxis protein [Vibrio paracholerae]